MKKILAVLALVAAFVTPSSVAFAHQREVFRIGDKQYLFVIGSLNEPVVVDDKTGVELRIKIADPAKPSDSASTKAIPVTGLETTLKVELQAGDKKKTLSLEPAYNDPGAYKAPFYPTVATSYTYRVFGTLNNTPVDVSFTCNPAGHPAAAEETTETVISTGVARTFKAGAFGCPKAKPELGFPEASKELVSVGGSSSKMPMAVSVIALALSAVALVRKPRA